MAEAVRLTQAGFLDVKVLVGGARAYAASSGVLQGSQPDSPAAFTLAPAELLPLLGRKEWQWVRIRTSSASDAASVLELPGVLECEAQELPARMGGLAATQSNLAGLIVFDDSGSTYPELESLLIGSVAPPVFYVHAGAKGLAEALETEASSVLRRTVTQVSGEAAEAIVQGNPGRSGGCCGRAK